MSEPHHNSSVFNTWKTSHNLARVESLPWLFNNEQCNRLTGCTTNLKARPSQGLKKKIVHYCCTVVNKVNIAIIGITTTQIIRSFAEANTMPTFLISVCHTAWLAARSWKWTGTGVLQVPLVEQHYHTEFGKYLKPKYKVERVSGESQLKISFTEIVKKNDVIICTAQILENYLERANTGEDEGVNLSGMI